jgi:hypothetical protein
MGRRVADPASKTQPTLALHPIDESLANALPWSCHVLLRYLVLDRKASRPRPTSRVPVRHLTSARFIAVPSAGPVLEKQQEKFYVLV